MPSAKKVVSSKPPTDPLRLHVVGAEATPSALQTATAKVVRSKRIELGSARSADARPLAIDAADDDVVRVELADGLVVWSRVDDLLREHAQPRVGRAGAGGGWSLGGGLVPQRRVDAPAGAEARGVLGLAITALELFGVDVSGATAVEFARQLEKRRLVHEPGLYRIDLDAAEPKPTRVPDAADALQPGVPMLVFLHGTMSSLLGSFGDLWAGAAAGSAAAEARAELRKRYGDQIYAWEHHSLTTGPIANALELVRLLPDRAQLHFVSHSRGGLIGELIALAQRERGAAGDPLDAALASAPFTQAERNEIDELVRLLDAKAPTVARFVRIACPARGTTLASGRLDRWLSVLSLIAPSGLASDLTDFLLKVVKERTDPDSLPGLAAMMPGSPLTRLLHWPGLVTQADLSVISGDIDPAGTWGKLKWLAADWFYDSDHDLIVNTGSMSGGVTRAAGRARQRMARGPRVHHFRYMANPESLGWLVAGLLRADDADAGFGPLQAWSPELEPRARAALRASRTAAGERPIALIVPGALGSALSAGGQPIWLDWRALFLGGLGRIEIDADRVETGELIGSLYAPLIEHLAATHAVHTLPYDWRRSVRDSAARLARKLDELLPLAESRRVPLHIVAHSMGGLVARALVAEPAGRAAWQRFSALPGARLLMLGTPNAGSHEAMRWFTGFNPTQARLALLDLTRGVNGVIDIVRRYPGIAELLPTGGTTGDHDHHDPAFWTDLRRQLGAGFAPAEADVLAPARETWRLLAQHPLPLPEGREAEPLVVYVAGEQPATVVGHEVVEDRWMNWRNELQFIATPHGDGTVSWASGRLAGVPMYLARDTAHDDLCSNDAHAELFAGYRDLLETGRTSRLPAVPDRAAGTRAAAADDAALRFVLREPAPDALPDPQTLSRSGFGARVQRVPKAGPAKRRPPLRLTVQNRNLKFLDQPLMIGHYAASRLTSTEALVDRQIGGSMSQSLAAGRYPEAPGTHQIFRNRRLDILLPGQLPRPAAAIVVGLGAEGQLRFAELSLTVRQAVIAFAQQRLEDGSGGSDAGSATRDFELAATLIGSGGLGIDTGTAAKAIALGVDQANQRLANTGSGWPLVRHLHLVELYLDRATEAFHALQVLQSAESGAFELEPALRIDTGAKRRTVHSGYRGARYDWFSALTLHEEAPAGDRPSGVDKAAAARRRSAIAFTLSTRRARSEVRATSAQWPLLHSLVSEASNNASQDRELGRTLFRLVIPAEIETFLGGNSSERATDLMIELDDGTAAIPWELLDSRDKDDHGMPWAIRTRLLRRLKTQVTGDAAPRDASADDDILVIGEPEVDLRRYGALPGARREAEAVVRQLTSAGGIERNRVHTCIAPPDGIGPDARCVITQLLARPYRAVHIAAHGEPGPDGGVVLSHESMLGPREVRAMRRIPELVFLNCCHLARGADGALLQTAATDRVAFAAGLARELIGSGVRCVIAAGWAVDDEPAADFATSFYQHLLAGRRFIDAVGEARRHAWQHHSQSNTWAAYQCYGDPDWVWRDRVGDAQQLAQRPAESLLQAIASPPDLALALENLTLDVRFGDRDRRQALDTLAELAGRHGQDWGRMGAVADAFGTAWLGCGELAQAAQWFERALAAEDGSASLKVVEQLANARARAAVQAPPVEARRQIKAAIELLERAEAVQSTRERSNLLGSACKRLALIEIGDYMAASGAAAEAPHRKAVEALRTCARYYGAAEQSASAEDLTASFYPSLNRIAIQTCLDLLGDSGLPANAAALDTTKVIGWLQRRNREQPDFWSIAGVAELQVIEALHQRQLAAQLPAVLRALDDLHDRQPAPNQWASVRDQARLVLLPYQHRRDLAEPERAAARELLATLEGWCRRDDAP